MESGRGYYLFNIYQAKFLGEDGTLQALNVGMPACFMATEEGFVVCGTTYQATKNDAGYYQLIDLQEYQEWMSKKKFTLASFNETVVTMLMSVVWKTKPSVQGY